MIAQLIAALLMILASRPATSISVSAAISLREPLREIAAEYERETGVHVDLNLGASGQLMAQIREGAPADLFIAAAEKPIDELIAQKLLDPATRVVIARNRLVLIVPAAAKTSPAGFADLADPRFKRVAVGEPQTVPAGEYAKQVFASLGLSDAVKDRLVYGTNVRQVLSYVEREEVDAGVVYQTDARIAGDKVRVVATADESWHEPIAYPAAVVGASRKHDEARAFLNYVRSGAGQRILARYGFLEPDSKQQR